MNQSQTELERKSGIPPHPQRAASVVSLLTGAFAGALIGVLAFGGPLVILMGVVVGTVAGGAIGLVVRAHLKRQGARDAVLDREIGVIGGDIGAAPPDGRPIPH